jgi:hypothetical protein
MYDVYLSSEPVKFQNSLLVKKNINLILSVKTCSEYQNPQNFLAFPHKDIKNKLRVHRKNCIKLAFMRLLYPSFKILQEYYIILINHYKYNNYTGYFTGDNDNEPGPQYISKVNVDILNIVLF